MLSVNGFNLQNVPLTQQELALAKEHRVWQKNNSVFRDMVLSDCDETKREAAERWAEVRNNCDVFRSPSAEHREAMGLQISEWCDETFLENLMPSFGLPRQGFSFDASTNRMTIGVGSRVQMKGYRLHVHDNMVGAITNDGRNDPLLLSNMHSDNTKLLTWLIHAAVRGNASWAPDELDLMIDGGSGACIRNQNTLSFLEKLGVDISRTFWINDTAFEVRNGFLQTVGFHRDESKPMGRDGLNQLVKRAYEQNMLIS